MPITEIFGKPLNEKYYYAIMGFIFLGLVKAFDDILGLAYFGMVLLDALIRYNVLRSPYYRIEIDEQRILDVGTGIILFAVYLIISAIWVGVYNFLLSGGAQFGFNIQSVFGIQQSFTPYLLVASPIAQMVVYFLAGVEETHFFYGSWYEMLGQISNTKLGELSSRGWMVASGAILSFIGYHLWFDRNALTGQFKFVIIGIRAVLGIITLGFLMWSGTREHSAVELTHGTNNALAQGCSNGLVQNAVGGIC